MKGEWSKIPDIPIEEMNLGQLIKAARVSSEVSQSELAAGVGIPKTSLSYWENGKSEPKISICTQIADFLIKNGSYPKWEDNKFLSALVNRNTSKLIQFSPPKEVTFSTDSKKLLIAIFPLLSDSDMDKLLEVAIELFEKGLSEKQEWLMQYMSLPLEERNNAIQEFKIISNQIPTETRIAFDIQKYKELKAKK